MCKNKTFIKYNKTDANIGISKQAQNEIETNIEKNSYKIFGSDENDNLILVKNVIKLIETFVTKAIDELWNCVKMLKQKINDVDIHMKSQEKEKNKFNICISDFETLINNNPYNLQHFYNSQYNNPHILKHYYNHNNNHLYILKIII